MKERVTGQLIIINIRSSSIKTRYIDLNMLTVCCFFKGKYRRKKTKDTLIPVVVVGPRRLLFKGKNSETTNSLSHT